MKIIGIDPGIKGGLAVIENEKVIDVSIMPTYEQNNGKNIIDFKLVGEYIKKHNPDKVYLEKVSAGLQGGRVSMFNFGVSFGGLMSCIIVLNYPLFLITPQRWKKIVLSDKYDHVEKEGTIKFCQTTFPNINLLATPRSKIPHDGICDAISLAYYGVIDNKNVK